MYVYKILDENNSYSGPEKTRSSHRDIEAEAEAEALETLEATCYGSGRFQ